MYEVAQTRNSIAVLETGIDKFGVINLLIKPMPSSDSPKRFIICLAPTVILVKQATPYDSSFVYSYLI